MKVSAKNGICEETFVSPSQFYNWIAKFVFCENETWKYHNNMISRNHCLGVLLDCWIWGNTMRLSERGWSHNKCQCMATESIPRHIEWQTTTRTRSAMWYHRNSWSVYPINSSMRWNGQYATELKAQFFLTQGEGCLSKQSEINFIRVVFIHVS